MKIFNTKMVKIFPLRNTLKRIFMLFPEFTKNKNPTKSDQVRPNPTKSGGFRRTQGDLCINQSVKKVLGLCPLARCLFEYTVFFSYPGYKIQIKSHGIETILAGDYVLLKCIVVPYSVVLHYQLTRSQAKYGKKRYVLGVC